MSSPIFRHPRFLTEVLNILPLLAFGLYALKFTETAGAEAAVIRVFIVYGLFPAKKLVFAENARRRRWFVVLYTPHLLFGLWLSWWGCTHGWFLSLLYLLCSIACYGFAMAALGRPAGDDEPI